MIGFAFFGLAIIDIVVILLYFSMMIWLGYRAMKRIHNQEDFFLGGRRFGKWIQTFAAFGQATSAESGVVTTTMVRNNGAAGILAGLLGGLLLMPILWMTSIWYRRIRLLTLADFFVERYESKAMAAFYSFFQMLFFMIVVALAFNALGKTIAAMTPKPLEEMSVSEKAERTESVEWKSLEEADFKTLDTQQQQRLQELRLQKPNMYFSYVNETILIVVVAFIVLLYAVSGGLEAAFVTDMIQGIFTIILSLLLIPFAIIKLNKISGTEGFLGSFEALHQKLPESFFELWGSPLVLEFSWYWILAFAMLSIINTAVQANQLTACGSAKDEYTARYGFVSGIFLKRYSTVIWGFVALITVALYSGVVENPDYMWGYAARDLLGPLGIGLVGLLIACMMAALMSLADCLMITTSSLLTNNLYRLIVPNRSEHHYVWAGRVFSLIFIIGCVLIATNFKQVFTLTKLIWMFNCILAASFWLGMLWRRTTRTGAWVSMIVTALYTVFLPVIIPLMPGVRTNESLLKTTEPAPMVRTYIASEMDVDKRKAEIEKWTKLDKQGLATGTKPQLLAKGQKFEKTFTLPKKSIFWVQGIEIEDGQKQGTGMLKVELVLLDMMGFDLHKNSYSFNETLTAISRIIIPFAVLIFVSLLTKPNNQENLDRFFAKMKTQVKINREEDEKELALSYANPRRFDHLKLFPKSNWEFRKWNSTDIKGISVIVLLSASCFLLLYLIVNLGK